MAIKTIFPDTTFISSKLGYDLSHDEGMEKFRKELINHTVLINSSQVMPGIQLKVLQLARETWTTGHVFNIGSICEFEQWHYIDKDCTAEKLELRKAGLDMFSKDFKTTHVVTGGFQSLDSHSDNKMDPIHIAKVIKFALEFEKHIPIISVYDF